MADTNKRYYWLKLPEDFFRQKEIKQLRKLSAGDVYTIIYLKMLLRSLKDNGKLYFDGIEDDFASELALDIDEGVEDVRLTVTYLMAKGLLVQNTEDEYKLSASDAMTGSESYSAERMRRHRGNKLLASQCDTQVTHGDASVTGGDASVTAGDEEIDIEIDKEIDKRREEKNQIKNRAREDNPFGYGEGDTPKIDTVQKYAASVLQTLSMRAMQELNDFVDELGEDVCWHGIDNALDNGKRVWAYVRSILNTYADEGIKTVADAKAYDAKRHQRPSVAEKPAAPVDPDAFLMPPNQAGDGGLSYFKRDGRYYRLLKSGRTEQVPETRSDGTPFDPTIPWVRERLIEYDGPLNPKPVLQD